MLSMSILYSSSCQPYSVIARLFSWSYSRGQASFVSARENFQNLSGKPHHFFSCMTWWFIVITLKWPLSGAVSWIYQNLATFSTKKRQMTQRSIHFPTFLYRSSSFCAFSGSSKRGVLTLFRREIKMWRQIILRTQFDDVVFNGWISGE